MTSRRVAHRYAKSIFDLAQEGDSVEVVHDDFLTVAKAIDGSRELRNLLASPIVDDHLKSSILTSIFSGKVSDLSIRFIQLLARKGRSRDLPAVLVAFLHLRDLQRNETPAVIRTAVELRDDQRAALLSHLETVSGRTLRPSWIHDEHLISGFTANIEDMLIDASARNHLERLRRYFIEGSAN